MQHDKKVTAVRLDDTHMQVLDDLRRREPDIPTRSEMIRRIIERAGAASGGVTVLPTDFARDYPAADPSGGRKGKRG